MTKVLVAPMTLAGVAGPYLDALNAAGFELVIPTKPVQLLEDELLEILKGVQAAVAGSEPYTPRVLAAHPQLKVIARVGVGYDAVDVPAATRHGCAVTIAPNTNQEAVAELAFCLMLGFTKNLVAQHTGVKEGRWPRGITLPLRQRTLGIAGLGRIGKAMAVRAFAFGMKVIAFEPLPDRDFVAKHGIPLVSFDELLAQSDFLSLHLPLTKESKHLINRQTLAKMKPGAVLVNTARGGLVCEADLVEALRSGRLAGACLDVFEDEPPDPKNPLFQLDNVVMTPHAAGTDTQSLQDMALSAVEAIVALSRGKWPAEKIVNPEVKATFRW
jgi:phosphoglycerate dehydrogenase-like enzyme